MERGSLCSDNHVVSVVSGGLARDRIHKSEFDLEAQFPSVLFSRTTLWIFPPNKYGVPPKSPFFFTPQFLKRVAFWSKTKFSQCFPIGLPHVSIFFPIFSTFVPLFATPCPGRCPQVRQQRGAGTRAARLGAAGGTVGQGVGPAEQGSAAGERRWGMDMGGTWLAHPPFFLIGQSGNIDMMSHHRVGSTTTFNMRRIYDNI